MNNHFRYFESINSDDEGSEAFQPASHSRASLPVILAGLQVQMAECVLHFDRPTALRPLATATVRGLAGHALTATDPKQIRSCFKPGQNGHLPPAYLFQPLQHHPCTDNKLPFRIFSWDSNGQFLPAQLAALERSIGRHFGESGSCVSGFQYQGIDILEFAGIQALSKPVRLDFLTPVAIKFKKNWLDECEITLAYLCLAMVRRLNLLSRYFGNGLQIDPNPWMAEAALCHQTSSGLHWVSPCRRSSTQGSDLSLAGLIGQLDFNKMPGTIQNLLSLAAVFHLGYHTAVGAGLIQVIATKYVTNIKNTERWKERVSN